MDAVRATPTRTRADVAWLCRAMLLRLSSATRIHRYKATGDGSWPGTVSQAYSIAMP